MRQRQETGDTGTAIFAVHIIPINQLYYPLLTENIILYKGQVTTARARTGNIATKYENVFSVSYKAQILQDYHSTVHTTETIRFIFT